MLLAVLMETKACRTASGLLSALNLDDKSWNPRWDDWIFRGESTTKWDLLPKSLRSDTQWKASVGPHQTNEEQWEAEIDLALRFLSHADRAGFTLPTWFSESRETRMAFGIAARNWLGSPRTRVKFPPDRLFQLLAMAQHHGVATRLLDWSTNPLKALYFAAQGAIGKSGGKLRIWALRAGAVLRAEPLGNVQLEVISIPSSVTRNLWAQEGLFILHREACLPHEPPNLTPLDKVVEAHEKHWVHWFGPQATTELPLLKVFTLPHAQVKSALQLLAKKRVTGADVYPSLDGVAQAVNDETYYS